MGHGDGTGRIVSAPGADDSGTKILHVDMDAFYAAVEAHDNPALRGKPIIIGSPESRSVVSSASYEARRFGVRAAMPVSQAMRLCPQGVVVEPHFDRYIAESRRVMEIFEEITPEVEPLSIDEAFLDVSGARRLWGSPGQIAVMLRERVLHRTGLVCSVGVAATKHVAKMASTISKPNGLLIIAERDTLAFIASRPVRALWGVGPKAADSLAARGIHTGADVLEAPRPVLHRALGEAMGERLWHLVRGIDDRSVQTSRTEKSIGHEETFATDITDHAVLRSELRRLADRVAARLRDGGWEARTIALRLRTADFHTVTRSQSLREPTDVGQRIGEQAIALFDRLAVDRPVRLVGVRAEALTPAMGAPPALWDDDDDWRRVDDALDGARTRFGRGIVTRASILGPRRDLGAAPTNLRGHEDLS